MTGHLEISWTLTLALVFNIAVLSLAVFGLAALLRRLKKKSPPATPSEDVSKKPSEV